MKQGDGKTNGLSAGRNHAATNGVKKTPKQGKCDLGPDFVAPDGILAIICYQNLLISVHWRYILRLFFVIW